MAEGSFNPHIKKMDKKKKKVVMSRRGKGVVEFLCDKKTQPLRPNKVNLLPETQVIEDAQKRISSRRPTSSRQTQNKTKSLEERRKRVKRLLREKAKEAKIAAAKEAEIAAAKEAEIAAAKEAERAAREAEILNQGRSLCGYEFYLLHYPRGRLLHQLRCPRKSYGVYAIRYSSCGEYIVAGFGTGLIQVWKANNGTFVFDIPADVDKPSPVTSIRFLPNFKGLFAAACSNGEMIFCDTNADHLQDFDLEPEDEINAMDINHRGDVLATGSKDGHIRVYNTETLQMTVKYTESPDDITGGETTFNHRSINALQFVSYMRETLVSGGWDNCVKMWDLRVPEGCVRKIIGPHLCGDALDTAGYNVVTGSWVPQDSVQLWDMRSGNLISTFSPINRKKNFEGEFLHTIRFLKGSDNTRDSVIIAGSGLKDVEIVNLVENEILGNFPVTKPIWALHNTNRFLTFGGLEPVIKIADYMKPDLVRKPPY